MAGEIELNHRHVYINNMFRNTALIKMSDSAKDCCSNPTPRLNQLE